MTTNDIENNERDVAKSPSEVIILDILRIKKDILNIIKKNEVYNNQLNKDVISEIKTLYYYIRSNIKRDDNTLFNKIEQQLKEKEVNGYINTFLEMDEWLDKKRIIRVDNIKHYDRSSMEKENKQRGYG
jgi:hemerythrin-like domain-containing protein